MTAPGAAGSATTAPEAAGRRRDLGVLALATLAPVWGYGWVASKVALSYSTPLTFAALRAGLSIPCLFLVLVVARRSLRPTPLGYTLAIGLLQTTGFVGLGAWALSSGGAGKVAVLTYTMPFWLLLLARAFLGERLRGLQWSAVALAFAGLVLVVRPWDIGGALSGVLACGGGLSWAAGAMMVKLLQRRAQVDAISLTAWQMGIGGLPLIAAALLTHSGWPVWSGTFVWTLAYSALLSNAVCWVLWAYALHSLPAGAAGIGTLAIPVVGVIAAWIQLGEAPALLEGVGMTLIIVALAVLAVRGLLAARRGAVPGGQQAEPELLPVID